MTTEPKTCHISGMTRHNCAANVFKARIEPGGWCFEAPANLSLLKAAEQADPTGQTGLQLPSSCRNGTCRSCLCQLISGAVVYQIEWPGLSAEEKQSGLILPCVAFPASDVVLALPF